MAKKKMVKKKTRAVFVVLLCLIVNGLVIYYISGIFIDVLSKQQEKDELIVKLDELKEEGETLKLEVTKLQNSEYVAKYAREKYLYSADGEYIIRIK